VKRLKNLILGAQLWPRRQCIHYAASGDAGSVVSKRLVPDEGKQAGQPAFSWLPRRSGAFEPASFRDRYQDALHELVEAKTKRTGDDASCDRRTAQGHQSDGSLEAQCCTRRGAGAEEGGREQTHACKSCPRPASTGAATARARRSREEERTRCGAGCFNRPKAPEEGRMTLVR